MGSREPQPVARSSAYDAFISYSRSADGKIGPALQRGLQRFAKPWYRLRALRVFRDDASLSANPDLWGSIEQALDDSSHFILLASPAAARSPWVAKEAEYWLEHRGTDQVLVVLTEGELLWSSDGHFDEAHTSALPPPLEKAFAGEEPRYVDLRWAQSDAQLAQRDARFRDALADLAAPLHGRSKDEMLGEDVRQHKRTLAVAWSAAAMLAALAAGASVLAVLALQQRDQARMQANIALSRQLAAESQGQLDGPSAVSPLLALESYRRVRTQPAERSYDARNSMLDALERSPRLIATLPGSRLDNAAFSPDGRTLVTADYGGNLGFWDARDGSPLGPLRQGSGAGVRAMAFSPHGTMLAVGDDKGRVTIWDARRQHKEREAIGRAMRWIKLITFSPDESRIAVVGSDSANGPDHVRIWRTNDLAAQPRELGEDTQIDDAVFTQDGNTVLSTDDGEVMRWGPQRRQRLRGESGYRLTTGRDGRALLLAKVRGGSRIVDALSGKPLDPKLPTDGEFFTDVAGGGRTVAAGSSGATPTTVRLWSGRGAKAVAETMKTAQAGPGQYQNYAVPVLNRDGTELASVGGDGTVKLWDTRAATPLAVETLPAPGRGGAWESVAVAGRGRAAAGDSTSVTFWDDGARSRATRRPALWGAGTIAFSPDGRLLASVGSNGAIDLWNVPRHRVQATLPMPAPVRESVWALAFSADGSTLTARGPDGVVVWNTSHRKPSLESQSRTAPPPSCRVHGLLASKVQGPCSTEPTAGAFAPDGTLVYSTVGAGVKFWDPAAARSLGGLNANATHIALAPDGLTLATASPGGVQLWDVKRRQPLGEPLSDSAGVTSLMFASDGARLASGRTDGTVTIWDPLLVSTDLAAWQARLCRLAGRNLTPAEWAQFLPGRPYRKTCPGLP